MKKIKSLTCTKKEVLNLSKNTKSILSVIEKVTTDISSKNEVDLFRAILDPYLIDGLLEAVDKFTSIGIEGLTDRDSNFSAEEYEGCYRKLSYDSLFKEVGRKLKIKHVDLLHLKKLAIEEFGWKAFPTYLWTDAYLIELISVYGFCSILDMVMILGHLPDCVYSVTMVSNLYRNLVLDRYFKPWQVEVEPNVMIIRFSETERVRSRRKFLRSDIKSTLTFVRGYQFVIPFDEGESIELRAPILSLEQKIELLIGAVNSSDYKYLPPDHEEALKIIGREAFDTIWDGCASFFEIDKLKSGEAVIRIGLQ